MCIGDQNLPGTVFFGIKLGCTFASGAGRAASRASGSLLCRGPNREKYETRWKNADSMPVSEIIDKFLCRIVKGRIHSLANVPEGDCQRQDGARVRQKCECVVADSERGKHSSAKQQKLHGSRRKVSSRVRSVLQKWKEFLLVFSYGLHEKVMPKVLPSLLPNSKGYCAHSQFHQQTTQHRSYINLFQRVSCALQEI